jgi:hypothetical protein
VVNCARHHHRLCLENGDAAVRRILTSVVPTFVTGVAGLVVLASLILSGVPNLAWLGALRVAFVDVAVIVAGVAVVMGFLHLLYVHTQRVRQGKGAFYSIFLILSALAALVVLIVDRASSEQAATRFIFDAVIVPMQTTFGALLAVFLAMAAFRMLQRRRSVGAVWFLLAALIVLITQIPLPVFGGLASVLQSVRDVFDAATTGGMRGLLLGVALGTLATAFRVLFFIDRPQSE